MSDLNQAKPVAPEVAPKAKGVSSIDLNTRIAETIATTAPTRVLDNVVSVLVDKEVEKRATALLGGLELANSTRGALKKAQEPDVRPTAFKSDGSPIGEVGFTKPRLVEQKKLTEKLAKIEKAIEAATREDEPNFGLLYNLKNDIDKAEKEAAAAQAAE
jgi:hypothetical protein